MDVNYSQVYYPSSFNELFSVWDKNPNACLYAGGTEIIWRQAKNIPDLPDVILSLDNIIELRHITRTERYLEIGAMVKLNSIIWLGKTVPQILCTCLENIAGVQVRNLATIGGNICCSSRLLDTSAPLVALDAQYELRKSSSTRWVAASWFHSEQGTLKNGELLTRIRLPLDKWDYSFYKRFPYSDIYNTEVLVFLAKTRKNTLIDLNIVFKGESILRNKNSEGLLIGKSLPLSRKTAVDFVENWTEFLKERLEINDLLKNELICCIEYNIFNLSE